MADLEAIEKDVLHVLKMIPPEVVHIVHELATSVLDKYRAELPNIAFTALTKLQPHVKALGLELSTGMMQLSELEPVLKNALETVVNEHAETRKAG